MERNIDISEGGELNKFFRLFSITLLCATLSGCFWWHAPHCVICTPEPIKPFLRHLEKTGVSDEQRRMDCRACGGSCLQHYPPHVVLPLKNPPNFCWSNPEHPELCTDILDSHPGFPMEKWRAATFNGESPELSTNDYAAVHARLLQKWKECMFSKGYIWNPSKH